MEYFKRRLFGFDEKKQTNKLCALVRERNIPTERPPLVGEVSANFCGWMGYCMVSITDPYGRILGFLDRDLMRNKRNLRLFQRFPNSV
jgi:hypothetical protein